MNPSLLVFAARLPFPSKEKHNMDMKQAMVERRMVRKYTDKPIPTEIVRRINGGSAMSTRNTVPISSW